MTINKDMIELEKTLDYLKDFTSSIVWFDTSTFGTSASNNSPLDWLDELNSITKELQRKINKLEKYSDEELERELSGNIMD